MRSKIGAFSSPSELIQKRPSFVFFYVMPLGGIAQNGEFSKRTCELKMKLKSQDQTLPMKRDYAEFRKESDQVFLIVDFSIFFNVKKETYILGIC